MVNLENVFEETEIALTFRKHTNEEIVAWQQETLRSPLVGLKGVELNISQEVLHERGAIPSVDDWPA